MMQWIVARRFAGAVAGALMLAPGFASAASPADPHMEELTFLLGATAASHAQVEAGRLAAENAESDAVRALAERLAEHHEAASEELAASADAYGIEPVAEAEPAEQVWLDRLGELDGPAFDAVYAVGLVPALSTARWIYEREARHGMDPAVRAQAEQLVEANDGHRTTAQELADAVADDLPEGLHPEDRTFLAYAMNVNLSQVRLGEFAAERAQDEAVSAFARRMVEDHGPALEDVNAAAEARGLALLEEPGPVTQELRALLERSPDADFDFHYINAQVILHYGWFYRFEHETIHGEDEEVQALAAEGVELASEHHDDVLALVLEWLDGEAGIADGDGGTPEHQH